MGVDVYLKWDNQTKEQEKAQITGYCIDAGDVGYLRASYSGMSAELRTLEAVFPEVPYWKRPEGFPKCGDLEEAGKCTYEENGSCDGCPADHQPEMDFTDIENNNRFNIALGNYIEGTVNIDESHEMEKFVDSLADMFKGEGFTSVMGSNEMREYVSDQVWLNSLIAFWQLGEKLNRQGIKTYVSISW